MRVALLTDAERPKLTHDDRLLVPAFAAAGVEAVAAQWRDPSVDWAGFDGIVVRSPWDYHHEPAPFFAFLDRLDAVGARVVNSTALIRWNAEKSYLPQLAARGAPVPPTWRFVAGDRSLDEWVGRYGTLVVKPEVAGGGKDTWRVSAANQADVESALRSRAGVPFLAQPYLASIEQNGEISLVFFDRVFSHAVRKRAAVGGFLIHEEHGGSLRRAWPDPLRIEDARAVLGWVDGPLPYARVDLVEDGDRAWLIELELIEPELFFRFDRASAGRFVRSVLRALEGGGA